MRKPFFIVSLCCAILFIGGCTNTSVSSVDKFEVQEEKKNLIFQEEFTYNDGESDSSEFHRVEDDKAYISLERISANSTTSFFTNSIGYISLVDGSYHEIASFVDEDLRIWDYVADDNVILASTFNCGFYEVIYKNGDETKQIERKVPMNAETPATPAAIHNTCLRFLECWFAQIHGIVKNEEIKIAPMHFNPTTINITIISNKTPLTIGIEIPIELANCGSKILATNSL